MSPRDDYNDDDDNGWSSSSRASHGHNSPSSSHRTHYGDTSDFNTAILSKDGRFFGFKVSQDTAEKLQPVYGAMVDVVRRKAEKYGVPLVESLAKNFGTKELAAKEFAGKAGNVIGYGVILSKQITDFASNVYNSIHSLNELRVAVRPLSSDKTGSTHAAPLSGDNEVIANARAKINGIFWKDLIQTLSGALTIAPALYSKFTEQSAKNAALAAERELERIKNDPEAMAQYGAKKAGLEVEGVKLDSGINIRKATSIAIEAQRKLYEEEYARFASTKANQDAVKKELGELFDLKLENIHYKMKDLERYRIPTDELGRELRGGYGRSAQPPDEAGKTKLINEFKARFQSQAEIKRLTEAGLKAKFVRQNGAFDEDWTPFYDHGVESRSSRSQKQTLQDKIEEHFSDIEKTLHKKELEKTGEHVHGQKDEHGFNMGNLAAGAVAGLASDALTNALIGKAAEKYSHPMALDRILHLRRVLEKTGDRPLQEVPGIPKSNDKDQSYVQYVHNIFQQHQKDCNRTEIGERFTEHFDDVRWNDDDIQKMPDDQLSAYEYAVKTIAKRIKDGRMDAIALVELVGDKQKKIVSNDGRSFGPPGAGKDDVAAKATILKIVDEKTALVHAAQEQTDEQVNDKLGNFIFSVDDMKKALDSNALDKQQRAFMFTMFSDVVGSDEKLCEKLGIKNERCQELRKECKECFSKMLDGAVTALAEMIENEPEELEKKLKLTDKEKKLILSLAERVKEEGKDVADLTKDREEIKALETVVANATMTLGKEAPTKDENGKPQGFWQRLIAATKQPKVPKKTEETRNTLDEHEPDKDYSRRDKSSDSYASKSYGDEDSHSDHLGDDEGKSKRGFKPRKTWKDSKSSRDDLGSFTNSIP